MTEFRKAQKFGGKTKYEPEYHSTYRYAVDMVDEIAIHAVPGTKPERLVAERAPNQTDKEFNYAMATYQQTTLPVFLDTVHTMQRAFSDGNWMIDYHGEDDLKEYLDITLTDTPLEMSLEAYTFHVLPSIKLIDAMGCIAIRPWFIPTVETVEGEVLIDSQTLYEPVPYYYSSDKLVAYEVNRFYMFLTDEKSMVEWGNRTVREGLVFEFYDDTSVWKIVQKGKKTDWEFDFIEYYRHDLGFIPVDRLKGIPAAMYNTVIYQSLFLFATPLLNEVVLDSIMLRTIKASSVFPYRVMTGDICTNEMELSGQIQKCDGRGYFVDYENNKQIPCSVCYGLGVKNRISPTGALILRPTTDFNEGELKASQPAMYFVEPSTEIPKFLRDEIEKNTDKARNILHLRTSESTVKGSENLTATGMVLDEKALYSTVKMFSDQMFDLYEFMIDTIRLMRYGNAVQQPTITRSITFDFNTEYEYMERISLAIKNGLPPFVVYAIVYKYIKTMFYEENERASAFELLTKADRLMVLSYDQINMEVAKGTVASWEVILHDSGITLIKEILQTNPGFFSLSEQEKLTQLQAAAQARADSIRASQPTSGSNITDSILRAAQSLGT